MARIKRDIRGCCESTLQPKVESLPRGSVLQFWNWTTTDPPSQLGRSDLESRDSASRNMNSTALRAFTSIDHSFADFFSDPRVRVGHHCKWITAIARANSNFLSSGL
jgi:hypothetical protein